MQPAPGDDALQVVQIRLFDVVEEDEVQGSGPKPVLGGQHVEGASPVTDGADNAADPVVDAGVVPDTPRIAGVVRRQFDRHHACPRRGAGDAQCAVAAVGTQFQGKRGVGAAHRGVE